MSENTFWIILWSIVSITLICLMTNITIYNIDENKVISELVTKGTNPIAARCAIYGVYDNILCNNTLTIGK